MPLPYDHLGQKNKRKRPEEQNQDNEFRSADRRTLSSTRKNTAKKKKTLLFFKPIIICGVDSWPLYFISHVSHPIEILLQIFLFSIIVSCT